MRSDLAISVLAGGNSSERPGSLRSGQTIAGALRVAGFDAVDVFDLTHETFPVFARQSPDVAFVALHGGYGEDGGLQGALELMQIPYTGPGVAASAISADKFLFSRFVSGLGYKAPHQILVTEMAELYKPLEISFPIVLKPATQGCSYGLFFIESLDDLREKAEFSFKFGPRLILEEYIAGREVTVGVFHDPGTGTARVLPIAETVLKGKQIVDFEVKSTYGGKYYDMLLPSPLEYELQGKIAKACVDVFMRLGCRGYVRFDLRIDEHGEIYFLENNTSPGMLDEIDSDFPKMLRAAGISLPDFARLMVADALDASDQKGRPAPSDTDMFEYLGLPVPGAPRPNIVENDQIEMR